MRRFGRRGRSAARLIALRARTRSRTRGTTPPAPSGRPVMAAPPRFGSSHALERPLETVRFLDDYSAEQRVADGAPAVCPEGYRALGHLWGTLGQSLVPACTQGIYFHRLKDYRRGLLTRYQCQCVARVGTYCAQVIDEPGHALDCESSALGVARLVADGERRAAPGARTWCGW